MIVPDIDDITNRLKPRSPHGQNTPDRTRQRDHSAPICRSLNILPPARIARCALLRRCGARYPVRFGHQLPARCTLRPAGYPPGIATLRTNFHPQYDTEPFKTIQVADAGDVACNPYNIEEAIAQIEQTADELYQQAPSILSLGGDHTIAVPLLRSINKQVGPVALVHFDAHLDTWDTYFGAPYTHGTPFRRAAEENLFIDDASMHVGIRGPLYSRDDLARDAELGFKVVHCDDLQEHGVDYVIKRIRDRVGDHPLYLSIDIDVLDPRMHPAPARPKLPASAAANW